MNVLRTSWRHSLAAAALTLLVAGCSDAVADDPPADGSLPAEVGDDLSDAEGQLIVIAEGEEGEAGEREERERDKTEAREREEGERDEAERREPEAERARLTQELHGLEERAHQIKRELEGLRDDQDAEARELQGALREIDERMGGIRRELGGGERDRERPELGPEARAEAHVRELAGRRRELLERMQNLKRELQGLRRDDQAEQAGNLRRELQEMQEHDRRLLAETREVMLRLGKRPEGADRERPGPDRERLARRLEELKREIGRLKEAGRHEEAAERQREEREIIRQLEQRLEPPRPDPPAEDRKRRIHFLEAAIHNLREAGLHDHAEQLVVQMDRMARHPGRGDRPTGPPPPRPEPSEQPPHPELGQRLEQQDRVIHELNAAVRELRQEMGQMREMLQELLGRRREGGR